MKRFFIILAGVTLIVSVFFLTASRLLADDGLPNTATADVIATGSTSSAPVTDNVNLPVVSTNAGACTPSSRALIKFDVSDVTSTIGSATVSFRVATNVTSGFPRTLQLFQLTSDSWTESSATVNIPVLIGSSVSSVMLTTSQPAGATVTFPTSTELVNFLQAEAGGDNVASFAVATTSCPLGSNNITFEDFEGGSSVAPSLSMLTPTAVHLTSASAESGLANSSLIWLAIALPLAVAAILLLLRRRSQAA